MNNIPAFPMAVPADWDSYQEGMTLRDYFAGQIINGIMAGSKPSGTVRDMAERAYVYADMMLEVRDQ